MNILITGANGQLGNEMRILSAEHPMHTYMFSDVVVPDNSPVTIHPLDITDAAAVEAFVREHAVDLIVNCAAYTNVDKAEDDEATALKINADAVANLGHTGAKIIHVSTDYVFSGEACLPYREDEPVAPNTAYGRTKLAGEKALLSVCPEAVIIRTAWLYSEFGKNFVKTMIQLGKSKEELGVVYDQIGSPTYALDLAEVIFAAIEAPEWHAGIYHFTNEGVCSWYDFTIAIHQLYNAMAAEGDDDAIRCHVRPIRSEEYAYRTPRPHYSVLDKAKIKQTFGIRIEHWQDALTTCMLNMCGEM